MAHPAIFLDRDNTIIEDPGYIARPELVKLLPGVGPALNRLAHAGFKLVVVSNQSGIARGLITEQQLTAVNAEMQRQLADEGVRLDAIYCCPFHPEGKIPAFACESDDRKPNPGMLLRASRDLALDLPASWMIGDADRDIQAGRRAGCRTILLHHARPVLNAANADHLAADLSEAADIVINSSDAAELSRCLQ